MAMFRRKDKPEVSPYQTRERGWETWARGGQEKETGGKGREPAAPDRRPIEPERGGTLGGGAVRWIFFLLFLVYFAVSYLHAPILRQVGAFLVAEEAPSPSDLIVCLMGAPVERGLAAAEVYRSGLAPKVFVAREALPDGWDSLAGRRIHYPESRDLLIMMLEALGVPRSSIVTSDRFVGSTYEEALAVKVFVKRAGHKSIIVITSPVHTRRAGLTYRKVFEGEGVEVAVTGSAYSGFRPEDWWIRERYLQDVVIEYLKLVYYWFRYL